MLEITTRIVEPQAEIEILKGGTLWWTLPALFLAATALYVVARAFTDPIYGTLPGVILPLRSPSCDHASHHILKMGSVTRLLSILAGLGPLSLRASLPLFCDHATIPVWTPLK